MEQIRFGAYPVESLNLWSLAGDDKGNLELEDTTWAVTHDGTTLRAAVPCRIGSLRPQPPVDQA